MGIDATASIPGEEVGGIPVGSPPQADVEVVRARLGTVVDGHRVKAIEVPAWGLGRIVLAAVDSSRIGASAEAIEILLDASEAMGEGAELIFAVDGDVDPADHERALFMLMANMDVLRDAFIRDHRMVLDGTCKQVGWERNDEPTRPWPPIISMDPDVVDRIDRRKSDFGLA